MKTRRTYRAAAAACAMALAVGVTASAADAKTLRFTTQLPAKNFATQNAAQFAQCIADGSDIEIEIYDSAQLYRDKEVPQAVSSGAIDMGMTTTKIDNINNDNKYNNDDKDKDKNKDNEDHS